jgi:uncharacterized Zn finger protein
VSAEDKARRYLTEGRLVLERVAGAEIRARCVGDEGDSYELAWDAKARSWRCSCPAFGKRCAHVLALARVVRKP